MYLVFQIVTNLLFTFDWMSDRVRESTNTYNTWYNSSNLEQARVESMPQIPIVVDGVLLSVFSLRLENMSFRVNGRSMMFVCVYYILCFVINRSYWTSVIYLMELTLDAIKNGCWRGRIIKMRSILVFFLFRSDEIEYHEEVDYHRPDGFWECATGWFGNAFSYRLSVSSIEMKSVFD